MDERELPDCIVLADRCRRFQWQADVSGPGTNGCASDPKTHQL
jgi:hypothetical protein